MMIWEKRFGAFFVHLFVLGASQTKKYYLCRSILLDEMKRSLLIIALLSLLFCACTSKRSHDVDFYYWKSKCAIGETERDYFNQLGSKRLFVRLFDVDIEGGYTPPSSLNLGDSPLATLLSALFEVTIFLFRLTIQAVSALISLLGGLSAA